MKNIKTNFRLTPWLLATTFSITLAACGGGGQETILGIGASGVIADTTRPQVQQTVPVTTTPGPTLDHPVNASVVASFTEDMAPASITGTNFTVTCSAPCTSPVGDVSYVSGSKSAIFIPRINLDADTVYTATIAAAATDLAGNGLAGNPALLPAASSYVWTFRTGTTPDTVAPLVASTNPDVALSNICINKTVNAVFNEAMDPRSIETGTFMLATEPTGVAVDGVVAYDAQTNTATFDPLNDLDGTISYRVTIKGGLNGVKDLAGNALIDDKTWIFTTGTTTCQTAVSLGTSSNFVILASAQITNIPTSVITGDVGLTPDTGSNITGFSAPLTCPEVTGVIYAVDTAGPSCTQVDPVRLQAAKVDAQAAFIYATAAERGTPAAISGNLNGLTLYPGLYESISSIEISEAGGLTLDAQGDVDAVFIIRSATSITTLANSQVVLAGGAKAANVFWTAGSAVTLGANSVMKGTLIAGTAFTLQTGANLEGRVLTQGASAAAVTLDSSTITLPLP